MDKVTIQILVVLGVFLLVGLIQFVWRRYSIPTVVVSSDSVAVKEWGARTFTLRWENVRRLDAGVEGVSYYCIRLFADETHEVWHTYHGFGDFIAAVLKQWPEAEPGWDSLTDAEEGTWLTLWLRS